MKQNKSSFLNLDANITILIAYLGGLVLKWLETSCYFAWAIPLIIYLIETKNEFVKKQSAQATLLYLISSLASCLIYLLLFVFAPTDTTDIYNMIITGSLFLVGLISLSSTIIAIAITIYAVVSAIKTYNYEDYDIPYLSKYLPKFRNFLEILEGKNKNNQNCKCNKCNCAKKENSNKAKKHKIRSITYKKTKTILNKKYQSRTRVQKIHKNKIL